jgi:adenine-specific DNA methylase
LSYNKKGIIAPKNLIEICKLYGKVEVKTTNKSNWDYLIQIKVK